jgi:hypothetical protein
MTLTTPRISIAAIAIALLGFATPARAQNATFTDIRDAVPFKYFNPSPDATRVNAADPNTLEIGFESGLDPVSLLDAEFKASTAGFGNRIAADTLSFKVVAPAGYYISSITYEQIGTGSISRVADARGASSWVVDGQPASLGFFRTNPSLSRTVTFTDARLTVVPVSITTSLSVFEALGDATVQLTGGKVMVTVAPLEAGDVKKTALITISGFTGTYDAAPHGATGTATGVDGEDLSALLTLGDTFINAPGGTANWTFAGNAEYNAAGGSVAITINRAEATINVVGFSGTYDGIAHGATGTASGVINENLSSLLDLGATFTNVPGGTANWSFSGGSNYNPASGAVLVTINKATPILSWPQPAAVAAGTLLSATQLNATADVSGTFVYSPALGTVLTETQQLSAAFTPADTLNYNGATATVTITVDPNDGVQIVNPGPQTDQVGEDVRLKIRVNGGSAQERRKGVFRAAGLPAGLEIEDDGEIRGEPRQVGTSHVTVTFTLNGVATSAQFDWTIVPRSKKRDR